jgi:hypothetical protein
MPFQEVTQPVGGPDCFARSDDAAILTQAATLLALGVRIRGDVERLRSQATTKGALPPDLPDILPDEIVSALKLPPLNAVSGRVDSAGIRASLLNRYKTALPGITFLDKLLPVHLETFADIAQRQFREASASTFFELAEACLRHPQELVRVCAAASYTQNSSEPENLIEILAAGTRSEEPLVRDVAATALAKERPEHPALDPLRRRDRGAAAAGAGDTTMIIHGTFAANSTWWQPGGDFHSYILQSVRSDLYNKPDRFGWSGVYSDAARAQGAQDLVTWVNNHNEQGLDLITHSHGGNVAMLATHQGLTIGELVLLSCPVHFPKYAPDFSKITKKAVSIRVHADLVILADLGGQKFNVPQIKENILPIWFNHSASHDLNVWKKYNVPAMI